MTRVRRSRRIVPRHHNEVKTESDFFSGHLFCRDEEKAVLQKALDRTRTFQDGEDTESVGSDSHSTQLVVIEGPSGVGKTALAHSLLSVVESLGGYFVSGKLDRSKLDPNYVFSSAFGNYVAQVLGQGSVEMTRVQTRMNLVVGSEGAILVDVIPQLEEIIAQEKSIKDVFHSSQAESRFKYVLRLFLKAISTPAQPNVLFMDDIHLADQQTLDVFMALVNDSSQMGTLFVCALRDGEENTMAFEEQIKQLNKSVQLTRIKLNAFDKQTSSRILATMLKCSDEKVQILANLIFDKSSGNILHTVELLRALQIKASLKHDKETDIWEWDDEKLRIKADSLGLLLMDRLNRTGEQVQEMLKVASCLGSNFDEIVLACFFGDSLSIHLREAASLGLIKYNHLDGCYQFTHDCVKGSVYELIPEEDRPRRHFELGWKLWKSYAKEDLDHSDVVFDIMYQLMIGANCIESQRDRSDVAKFCLTAGVHAIRHQSFQLASKIFLHGIQLLGPRRWTDNYSLSIQLHNRAAEVAYNTGKFDSVFRLHEEACQYAKGFADTLTIQATFVYALGSSGHMKDALDKSIEVLKELGHGFSKSVQNVEADVVTKKISKLLKGITPEDLYARPKMEDPTALAAMHILNLMFTHAYLSEIALLPQLAHKMISLTMEFGMAPDSCVGFLIYAQLLVGVGKDIDEGYRYGRIALYLMEQFDSKALLGRASIFYGFVHGWKRPVLDSLKPLRLAYKVAIAVGDIEFAMLSANVYCWIQLDYTPLKELNQDIRKLVSRIDFYGRDVNSTMMKHLWQFVQNMLGKSHGDPRKLVGAVFNETTLDKERFPQVFVWSHFYRMMLCYFLGDFEGAWAEAQGCDEVLNTASSAYDVSVLSFFDAMTALAMAAKTKNIKMSRPLIARAEKRLAAFSEWSNDAPLNFLGKQYLIEAELAVVKGDHTSAHKKYLSGIALSQHADMLMQTALGYERLGIFCASKGDELASSYFKKSFELYKKWGAKLKVAQMQNKIKA